MSDLFKLNWKDLFNGAIMAVIGDVVLYLLVIFKELYQLVMQNQPFQIELDWRAIFIVAVFSFLSYLAKRFFSGTTGSVLVK